MPVTELYAFNLICENLLAALFGVALNVAAKIKIKKRRKADMKCPLSSRQPKKQKNV